MTGRTRERAQSGRLANGAFTQTLSRGLQVLEELTASGRPMTVGELAGALGVGRSVAYRLVRTLEQHRLVTPHPGGGWVPGLGLLTLARAAVTDLRTAAFPSLSELAERLGATAFLGGADDDELVCLLSVEPRTASGVHLVYREGLRHPISKGAAGRAILATRPAHEGESQEVTEARARGYTRSEGEVEYATIAIAAPVRELNRPCRLAVASLFLAGTTIDEQAAARAVLEAADRVAAALG